MMAFQKQAGIVIIAAFLLGAGSTAAQESSAWATQCISSSQSSPLECVAVHQMRTEANQLVFEISVSTRTGEPGGKLDLRAPLGFYIPSGVQLLSGEQVLYDFEIARCISNGCYSSVIINADQLTEFSRVGNLQIQFETQQGSVATIEVPTAGLSDSLSLITD